MRAVQIVNDAGPREALALVDAAPPPPESWLGGEPVTVEVVAAGVSFPELLQTRGRYQIKPPLPFVPGSEVSGVVRSAPPDCGLQPGQRVAAFCGLGGFAELAVAPAHLTFPLPDQLDFAQGAGLVLNYHTAYFSLLKRGRLAAGERVLVQGAAGGVGTAVLQVARALGAHTIALVSSERKREIALQAGAEQALIIDETWRQRVQELSGGGVDVVLDPVGGERFVDSLRCLREGGRLIVVGFTAGSIPEVKVNRLLLNNIEVLGAGWGASALAKPELCQEIGRELDGMIRDGFVAPIVGARFPLEQVVAAVERLETRKAVGKIVLELR